MYKVGKFTCTQEKLITMGDSKKWMINTRYIFFLLDKFIGKKQSLGNKLKLKFSTFGYMLVFQFVNFNGFFCVVSGVEEFLISM